MNFHFTLVVGLPGSGKTKFMQAKRKNLKQSRAYVFVFDDLTQSGGHVSVVKTLKKFVGQKRKFVPGFSATVNILISDFGFVFRDVRAAAEKTLHEDFPDCTIQYVFWENNPEACWMNVKRRGDHKITRDVLFHASAQYTYPIIEDGKRDHGMQVPLAVYQQQPSTLLVKGYHAHYERDGLFSTTYVLERIDSSLPEEFNGDVIPLTQRRYKVFREDLRCYKCGLAGLYFAKERTKEGDWHLNLYGVNEDGEEVLFTKDHVIPKSKGGSEGLDNLVTMCEPDNSKKADKVEAQCV